MNKQPTKSSVNRFFLKLDRNLFSKNIILLLFFFLVTLFTASAQTTISGRVTNSQGEGLAGVTVRLKGTSEGTSTNESGKYQIDLVNRADTLLFSYIGYQNQTIAIDDKSVINVTLLENFAQLNDVIVIGYGKESREEVTTSVSKMDDKVLENVPYSNVASALQGTLAGVRVQSGNGQPGATPTVVLRGGTSINNPDGSQPLYIVDGVIKPSLYNVSSDNIASIQVLKDAASTAIYGARGSNGVVIVTTKTGKAGQTRINYSYDLTISKVGKKYDMANAREYLTINRLGLIYPHSKMGDAAARLLLPDGHGTGNDLTKNTAFTTMYLTPDNKYKLDEGWQSMADPADPSKTLIFDDTRFSDIFIRTGISHNHRIDVSGGNEKATFDAGIGYLTNQGTVITTGYKRLSFNINGKLQVKSNLNFFASVQYANSKQENPSLGYDQLFYRGAGLAPTAKYKYEDGTLAPGTNRGIGNTVYYLKNRVDKGDDNYLTMITGAHWDILPGLSFDPQVSMFRINNNGYSFQPGYWNGPLSYVDSRDASASNYRWLQTQADAILHYDKSFLSGHNLSAVAGFTYYGREEDRLSAAGKGASTDLIPTLNAASQPTSVSSSITNQMLLSYFSRVKYNFKEKYLLSLSARYDGASSLGADHKWGLFPGVSAGWNVSKEQFWKSVPRALSNLKVRASYGVAGNISGLSDFASEGAYSVGYKYNGNSGIINTSMPNQDLEWERSNTFDVGLDIGLFENRVGLIFDYYRRVTDNLLTNLSLPQSSGFSSSLTNLGSLENKGFEIEANAQILPPSSAFQWSVSFNIAKTKNTILKLPSNGVPNNRIGGSYVWDNKDNKYEWKGGLQEGGTIGDMYSLKQTGIYVTDKDAESAPYNTYIVGSDKTVYGGDTRWLDNDRNDTIDSRDFIYMGNEFPNLTGGFSTSLSYKNISLYARFDYTLGHTIFDYAAEFLDGNLYADGNLTQRKYDKSWKKEGDNATMSHYYWGSERVQRNNFLGTTAYGNSIYYEPGNFLCLREITLSYNVPEKILQKAKINGLSFHVTGNNLHYFTNYYGLNPETGGKDNGRYPMPKNIIFGASITF